MIRVLSRLPESSMLGLSKISSQNHCPFSTNTKTSMRYVYGYTHGFACSSIYVFYPCKSVPLLLQRGSQGSNPAIVTLKGAAKDQLLSHDRSLGGRWKGAARGGRRMNAGGAIVVDSALEIKSRRSKMEESPSLPQPLTVWATNPKAKRVT